MKRGPPTMQQSLARVLGVINYSKHPSALPQAINYLLDGVKSKVSYSRILTTNDWFNSYSQILRHEGAAS